MADLKQQRLAQWETRKTDYTNTWKTGLIKAPCTDPLFCCIALCCPCCTSWWLRKEAMHGSLAGYTCCNGAFPCSGRCGERSCPELCLCAEVCCCFGMSVASTRWMIQDELHIQNTQCDNCIIGTMIFLQQLACICNIIACLTSSDEIELLADVIELLAEIVWWSVCACMQTQHKVQIEDRDKQGGGHVPRTDAAPIQQGPPGYPAPQPSPPMGPAYGYNPQGAYPPQQGYPQGGYAPQMGYAQPAPGGYPPQQGYPPQPGYPQGGYPPPQHYPPQYQ